ncbi:MAG: hypothetical protein H6642_10625 [Caldilineaceae bacterium]|nr:hypothetical protein [Caldilineaceae bacterium]
MTICFLIMIGIVVESIISVYLGQSRSIPVGYIIASIVALLPFILIVAVKAYFGPVVTIGSLAVIVFIYANTGVFEIPAITKSLYDLAASFLPPALEKYYVYGFTVYALVTSSSDANSIV